MLPIGKPTILSKPRGKFDMYKDLRGEYRWRIISVNGREIGASSEGFSTESYCIENIKLELSGLQDFLNTRSQVIKPRTLGQILSSKK